jgi:redox-sensitive bicupin YhaK (pirin superfamily)
MDRKQFIRKGLLSLAGVTGATSWLRVKTKSPASTYDQLMAQVGFNHLPPAPGESDIHHAKNSTMKTVIHRADTRGHANHGWLNTHHTFSFANYYNPERMHFGVLRVLNDDQVAPGRGFATHPHDNMEIISIPLEGDLEHKDSMGNVAVIRQGDVQVMSAGTGVFHSEYNRNKDQAVKFLQIWMFPREKNVTPRYDQISIRDLARENEFYQVLSPNADDEGVWVHQDAWFHLGDFKAGASTTYALKKPGNGAYLFVLEGNVSVEGQELGARDGLGLWDTDQFTLNASSDARVLLMDVPMTVG